MKKKNRYRKYTTKHKRFFYLYKIVQIDVVEGITRYLLDNSLYTLCNYICTLSAYSVKPLFYDCTIDIDCIYIFTKHVLLSNKFSPLNFPRKLHLYKGRKKLFTEVHHEFQKNNDKNRHNKFL